MRGIDVEITVVGLEELIRALEAGNQFYIEAVEEGLAVYAAPQFKPRHLLLERLRRCQGE